MKLKEYIEEVLKAFDGYSGEVELTFELSLDEECNVVDGAPHKIKFSCRTR